MKKCLCEPDKNFESLIESWKSCKIIEAWDSLHRIGKYFKVLHVLENLKQTKNLKEAWKSPKEA